MVRTSDQTGPDHHRPWAMSLMARHASAMMNSMMMPGAITTRPSNSRREMIMLSLRIMRNRQEVMLSMKIINIRQDNAAQAKEAEARDLVQATGDAIQADQDAAEATRDAAQVAQDAAQTARDAAQTARDAAQDAAQTARDAAQAA